MSDSIRCLFAFALFYCLCCHVFGIEYLNIAMSYRWNVSQSSTYLSNHTYSFVAENAVDGNTDKDFRHNSCTRTKTDNPVWWRIQFKGRVYIHRIIIYHRKNHEYALKGFQGSKVYISDNGHCDGNLVYNQMADPTDSLPWQDTFDISVEADGTYVVICNEQARLHLCEVQVIGCPYGRYGDQCALTCGHCHMYTCNLANGSCPGDCENHYMGPMCNKSCIGRCRDSTCSVEGCTGCVDGKHGVYCDRQCPPNCQGDKCTQYGGACTGCKESKYWSTDCSNVCSLNCNDDMCEHENGVCLGCTNNLWGNWCNKTCSSNCKYGICNRTNGYCRKGCISRYRGRQCEHDFQNNCKNGVCPQNDGLSVDRCEPGYYGEVCDGRCGSCIDDVCDQYTGICDGNCHPDYWGDQCNHTCPDNCFESMCTKDIGICGRGCSAGYIGYNCNEKCETGRYGFGCSDKCGNCYGGNVSCFHINGKCIDGCIAPFIGHSCHSTAEIHTADSSNVSNISGIGIAIGNAISIMMTVITALIYFTLRKACTMTKEKTNNDENEQFSENVTEYFSNVDTTREDDTTYETIDMETEH